MAGLSRGRHRPDGSVEPDSPQEITIAKRGDVWLKIGIEGENITKALVSSAALSTISPIFETMFNGRWTEGDSLSTVSPPVISLPGDDPEAMLLICKIAHFQTLDLPEELNPSMLADFVVACDKYLCRDAVHMWTGRWVDSLLRDLTVPNSEKALFITYLLDLPDEFYKVSQKFIRDMSSSIDIASAAHGQNVLPLAMFTDLWDKKEYWRRKAYKALSPCFLRRRATCEGTDKLAADAIRSLEKANILPFDLVCVAKLNEQVSKLKEVPANVYHSYNTHWHSCANCVRISDFKPRVMKAMEKIYNSVPGLCLDCVKREGFGVDRVCRIDHPGAILKSSGPSPD